MIREPIQKVIDDLKKGEGWKWVGGVGANLAKGNVQVYRTSLSIMLALGQEFIDTSAKEKRELRSAYFECSDILMGITSSKVVQSDLLKQIKLD